MGDFVGHPFRGNQYGHSSRFGERFSDYHDAAAVARLKAGESKLDVAIRGTKEYGKMGYTVRYASKNDSDYARAEIVKPGDPMSERDHERLQALAAKVSGYSPAKPASDEAARKVLGPEGSYAKALQAEDEAKLRTPEGEAARQARNAKLLPSVERAASAGKRATDAGVKGYRSAGKLAARMKRKLSGSY